MQAQKEIKNTDKETLWDIDEININKFDTIENKIEKFTEDTGA